MGDEKGTSEAEDFGAFVTGDSEATYKTVIENCFDDKSGDDGRIWGTY